MSSHSARQPRDVRQLRVHQRSDLQPPSQASVRPRHALLQAVQASVVPATGPYEMFCKFLSSSVVCM